MICYLRSMRAYIFFLLMLASPAMSQCRIAFVIALDVTGPVNEREYQ